jgi:hypothetical protein
MVKHIVLALGGYSRKIGKSAGNMPTAETPHTAGRYDVLAVYTDKRIRLGVEYFAAKNWNNIATVSHDKSDSWSVFGSFALTPQIMAFYRYDWVQPSKTINPIVKDYYFNLGIDYKPIPPLNFALAYKRDRANHSLISTSNGTIGGPEHGTYNELGLFGQLAF